MSKDKHKVVISGSIDPEVFEMLSRHCTAHPRQSRSQVLCQALRQFLLPEYQEQRQEVVARNLDKLWWHQRNQADHLKEELRCLKEMVALLVRTFYNHLPEVPETQRQAAALSGQRRFNQFLETLAENLGPGRSVLQQMPEPVDEAVHPESLGEVDHEQP